LRLSRLILRVAISLVLALAILWAAAALWIDGPTSRALAGTLAGGMVQLYRIGGSPDKAGTCCSTKYFSINYITFLV
jgi:hypothetical protein